MRGKSRYARMLGPRLSCIVVADANAQIDLWAELRKGEMYAARPRFAGLGVWVDGRES
ncbi:MAG TPA: hypothetical protein VHM25_13400 [Polyangiaceae bacterium]|nr:hypothetical protein [Polyangiaceae bacterium]